MYQIDIKFDRQVRPATKTSWVVSYGGETIPRWRTIAILKIVISPYLKRKIIRFSWNFVHRRKFWTGWTSRHQKWKSCIGQTPSSIERITRLTKKMSLFIAHMFKMPTSICLILYWLKLVKIDLLIYLFALLIYFFGECQKSHKLVWSLIEQSSLALWATLYTIETCTVWRTSHNVGCA